MIVSHLKGAVEFVMMKLGYVPDSDLRETEAELFINQRAVHHMSHALFQAEAEVEISRNLLKQCADVREQLREELSIVTTERDIAQGKIEDAEHRAYLSEGRLQDCRCGA